MIEETRKLLRLEDVDRQIREAEEELATFGPEREQAARDADADRAAIAEAEGVLAQHEQTQRGLEVELQDADRLVEKLDAQIYEVTSKQAMEVIQTETAAAKERKSELEDSILEALDAIEAATAAIADAEAVAKARGAGRASEEEARAARETDRRQELERLVALRSDEAAGVEAQALAQYEDARRKAWPVLARFEATSCPACRMMIPPQRRNDINSAKKIVTCGSCHRILYGDKVAEA